MSENTNVVNENAASKKATVLQAVKAVSVLVVICLVCCILLAVCNDLFYISDDVKFERSMQKIYPNFQKDESFNGVLDSKFASNADYGEINSVVKSTDGSYIIEAKGTGGYKNGYVVLYVIVGKDALIKSWTVKEHKDQSYLNRVPGDAGTRWYVGKEVSSDLELDMSGATVVATSTAINHAVNMAAFYCRSALGLGKNPEADAKAALLALLGDEFADYQFISANLLRASSTVDQAGTSVKTLLSDGDNEPAYVFVGRGSKFVTAYTYGEEESIKVIAFVDGAVSVSGIEETDALVAKVADFNSRLYTVAIGNYNAYSYFIESEQTEEGTVFTVSGIKSGTTPGTYVLKVTVVADGAYGKVTAIEAIVDGYEDESYKVSASALLGVNPENTGLIGATLDSESDKYIDTLYTDKKAGGATNSANLIRVAVEAALTRFDAQLASQN